MPEPERQPEPEPVPLPAMMGPGTEPAPEREREREREPEPGRLPEPDPHRPTLELLPDELIATALLPLLAARTARDLAAWRSVTLVSRRWRRLALSPELPVWRVLDAQRFHALWPPERQGSADTSAAFSARQLVPIAARCAHLRVVDLAGCAIGGMTPGVSMPEMVGLVRSCREIEAFRARPGAPTTHRLLSELAQLPGLTSLSMAYSDVTDAALLQVFGMASDQLYTHQDQDMQVGGEGGERGDCGGSPPPFPALQRLSVAHCAQLTGRGLLALVAATPTLAALSVDGCSQLHDAAIKRLCQAPLGEQRERELPASILEGVVLAPLSISALLHAPTRQHGGGIGHGNDVHKTAAEAAAEEQLAPGALDVSCGICDTVLWRGLRDYCLHEGQQPHIQSELTTNTPPIRENVAAFPESPAPAFGAPGYVEGFEAGRRWHCKQGCHGAELWLLDNQSGLIGTHDAAWAIACGPATSFAGRPLRPALGRYTPSSEQQPWLPAEQDPASAIGAAAVAAGSLEEELLSTEIEDLAVRFG